MRSLKTAFVLLVLLFVALGPLAYARGKEAADGRATAAPTSATATPVPAAPTAAPVPATASKEEVEQLRREVAELKATIQQLIEAQHQQVLSSVPAGANALPANGARLASATFPEPSSAAQPAAGVPAAEVSADPDPEGFFQADKKKDQKAAGPPAVAGWNGEHFFIKSADGQFQLQPYGYVQTDYRAFNGDGAPPNTFLVRRGRFGFQGNYGDHFSFGLLVDGAATSGAEIRDIFLNVKFKPEVRFQAGQFKVFFGQELATGATNLDFIERGLQSLLYPDAASAFRSLGAGVFGDIHDGVFQYWVGAFNGKGFNIANTTSVPEASGRIRFYPWRKDKDSFFQGFAFGGAIDFSKTRGLSNELTPVMTVPDTAYTYFPQFRTNGNIWRYNGEFTFLRNQWGLRGEYVQATFDRTGVGTLQLGGLGIQDLPVVRYKGWNIEGTYLLTGEKRPENGTPRIKHPLFGPETPGGSGGRGWGAWELALRYSGIQGKEPGIFFNNVFTPQNVAGFDQHTQNVTAGVNWYLNYWVKYQVNFSVDRLLQPSTIGATRQTYFVALQRITFRF
jgi:phosphate-selective porin OprO/OprP